MMALERETRNFQGQPMLTTRALQQHNFQYNMQQQERSVKHLPYIKPKSSENSVYPKDTTLESNSPAVIRRNARERNRVKQVNCGFSSLRQRIPPAIICDLSNGRRGIGPGANKKLSKVDTLRMALEYIRLLKGVIDDHDNSDAGSVSSYGVVGNSNSSQTSSPPPTPLRACSNQNTDLQQNYLYDHYQSQMNNCSANYYYDSTQKYQQMQTTHMPISPANSHDSAISVASQYNPHQYYSENLKPQANASTPAMKCEPAHFYEDYTNNSTDDEELLDYISLWQDEM